MKSIGYDLIMTVSSNPVLKKLFEDAIKEMTTAIHRINAVLQVQPHK